MASRLFLHSSYCVAGYPSAQQPDICVNLYKTCYPLTHLAIYLLYSSLSTLLVLPFENKTAEHGN